MKEQIEVLIKLQKVEAETVQINSTLKGVSKKLEGLDSGLKEFEQGIERQKTVINELKKQYRDYESDIQMNLSRTKKTQINLRSVKTNREYQSLLKEIDDVKQKNSKIEDHMIECLDQIDETEQAIAGKQDEYLQLFDRMKNEKEHINKEAEEFKKRLLELDRDRENITGRIDPGLLKKYLMVKEQHPEGLAMVPVKDAVCHGCNVNLPPQLYNELFRYDSLRYCPNCQRIIYLKES